SRSRPSIRGGLARLLRASNLLALAVPSRGQDELGVVNHAHTAVKAQGLARLVICSKFSPGFKEQTH
ncbi:MAG: hypothetical protein M1600_09395, partial [Firmicutes bacterium]|nr:hypothetical protein [Bacillota bacterium]